MTLIDVENFYKDGFCIFNLTDLQTTSKLINTLRQISEGNIKEGFCLNTKYPRSRDLSPSPLLYDQIFTDFILKNKITDAIENISKSYKLAHAQLRKSELGESYMDWHRDTYTRNGKWIGHTPPVFKVIFYPNLYDLNDSIPKLKVAMCKNRFMFKNYFLDKIFMRLYKSIPVYSSNSQVLIFDTSTPHAVLGETQKNGSYRLIYSFCHDIHLAGYDKLQS